MSEAEKHLGGESDHFEVNFRFSTKTGDWQWIQGKGKIVERNEKGVPLRFVGTHRDISKSKQIKSELRESEERFKALHNASFGGIAIHDKGIILEWNRGMEEMTGYSGEELIGMDGLLLIAEETRNLVLDKIKSGYEKPYEAIGLRKNGEKFPLRLEARNVPYKGKMVRTVEFRDITEQKKIDEVLRESEVHFRNLANSGQALIWTSGTDKKCIYFNQTLLNFTGRSIEQELGDGWIEGVHPDDLQRCLETYVAAFERRESFSMDYRIRHSSGEYRWIKDDGTPRYDSKNEFIGFIGHCLDITEIKLTEKALQESEERYRTTLYSIGDGVITTDTEGCIKLMNPIAEQLTGWTQQEAIGKTLEEIFIIINEETKQEVEVPVRKVLRVGI
jgi:PAS domain S-box-containing protein